jgi:hypothetical protein
VTLFHVFVVERDETAVVARGGCGGVVVMNTKYYFSNLFLGALFLGIIVWGAGCAYAAGSGIEGTSPRAVEPFSRLIVSGRMVVNLEIGDVEVHGMGTVVVNADEFLDATVCGLGKISYVGDPSIYRDVKGGGKVETRDDKVSVASASEMTM